MRVAKLVTKNFEKGPIKVIILTLLDFNNITENILYVQEKSIKFATSI